MLSTTGYQLATADNLLNHFLELRAEHIHTPIGV